MREIFEFRINEKFAPRLSNPKVGKLIGNHMRQVMISAEDPLVAEIGRVNFELYASERRHLFTFWQVKRRYSSTEIESAELFRMFIGAVFEPAGEECGTHYNESRACEICGAGAEQISDLFLDLRKPPRGQDIARTIANEWIVSRRLVNIFEAAEIRGLELHPVRHRGEFRSGPINLRATPSGRQLLERAQREGVSLQDNDSYLWFCRQQNKMLLDAAEREYVARRTVQENGPLRRIWPEWRQLSVVSPHLPVVPPTLTGVDPFDHDPEGRYRCPRGDNIGHTYLSEIHVQRSAWDGSDIMLTQEMTGQRRGLLRPTSEILVTPRLRKTLLEQRIKSVDFEVAHFDHRLG
jgi:hypothetical protein